MSRICFPLQSKTNENLLLLDLQGRLTCWLAWTICAYTPLNLKDKNLRIVQSLFAKGLILVGSHQLLKSANFRLSEDVEAIRHYTQASLNHISIHPVYNYYESYDMGVVPPKNCCNCRNCKECSFRGRMLSLKD